MLSMLNSRTSELSVVARVAPPDVAASGVAPDWVTSSSASSLQDNAFKQRPSFSIANFDGGSANNTTISAAQAAGALAPPQSDRPPKPNQNLNDPFTGAGAARSAASASPSAATGRWENRSFHPGNFLQTTVPSSGSQLPMGISGDEAAGRHAVGLFTPASGSFSSHRLMAGSITGMGVPPQDQGGVSNEPSFSSVSRSELMMRGEDFGGLYASVGRLSRDIEGGPNVAHSHIMNVGGARSGPKPAMVSFVGGDFRAQAMGRGQYNMEEGGITSMHPLFSASARGGAHEAEGPAVPWHHGDPSSSARDMLGAEKHAEALKAENTRESRGMGGALAEHQHTHQPLPLVPIEADRSGSMAELDQAQQHRLYEQQQQQRELMLRQRPTASLGGMMACHDCGNQAKKDCVHMRCRTCCKSRGFDCSTHVKSTWVPVSKRRQRLQQAGLLNMGGSGGEPHYLQSMKFSKVKRARTLSLGAGSGMPTLAADQGAPSHTSTSTAGTPPRSSDTNSAAAPPLFAQEAAQARGVFPPEVRMQAVLRCVKLTGIVDGQEEYAYQTEVQIGGHTFKGILRDQGAAESSEQLGVSSLAELHLGGRGSAALMDLSGVYGSGGNALLGAFR